MTFFVPALSAFAAIAFFSAASAAPPDSKEDWCAQLGKRLASVREKTCRTYAFSPAARRSVKGRPLMMFETAPAKPQTQLSATETPSAAPRVLLIGGIHGDELTSISIVFRWMEWLSEPPARALHWRIAPLANPDGLFARPARRVNGNGVDLNRNFPTPDWRSDALAYWKNRTGNDPRRYPGRAPMSEPETLWLTEEIQSFRPDVIISVHAPYGVLDYDGPRHKPRQFGRLHLNQLGVYPGSLGNFGGIYQEIPVVTIELPNAVTMPKLEEQRHIWNDMMNWIARRIAPKPEQEQEAPRQKTP
ncbi:MAG: murein peptide amidase A [Zoogloeaceae bacterium]|nr:murein peptide amidase A [Zoogloeaceae bacterium]